MSIRNNTRNAYTLLCSVPSKSTTSSTDQFGNYNHSPHEHSRFPTLQTVCCFTVAPRRTFSTLVVLVKIMLFLDSL